MKKAHAEAEVFVRFFTHSTMKLSYLRIVRTVRHPCDLGMKTAVHSFI